MVEILPFNGLLYNMKIITDIAKVLAPPYDVISEKERNNLKKLNPYNIVNLTLPDETHKKNRYENAKEKLDSWIRNKVLSFEENSCLYLIEESYLNETKKKSFLGFVGLLKIEDYKKGKILRHEMTLPKPKEDRLNLLKACRTNFEFIYTIYNDDNKEVYKILKTIANSKPSVSTSVDYDKSLSFKLWKISDKNIISKIINLLEPKTVLIADGHHRYETSRLYKGFIQSQSDVQESKNKINWGKLSVLSEKDYKPENYILTFFVAGNQKDILIHPTHRVLKFNKKFLPDEFIPILSKYFLVELIKKPSENLIKQKMIRSNHAGKKSFAIITSAKECFFITLKSNIKDIYRKLGILDRNFNEDFENLDVNLLHKFVLGILLKRFEVKEIKFIHTISELFEILYQCKNSTCFDAGFILNAPSIETVEKLSASGFIMPQKSTYFYPKPCSGLILYKFDKQL